MAIETRSLIQQVCIGVNWYESSKSKAMYINCLESYGDDVENSSGEYQVQHRCDYDDNKHFQGVNRPSFDNPKIVTCEGKFEVFANQKQFTVSSIIKVEPYKQPSNASTSPASK